MNNVVQSACLAHTLQLSVLKGLKSAAQLIKRAKNLILFFSKPKQTEHLKNTQEQYFENEILAILEQLFENKIPAISEQLQKPLQPPVTTITAKELYDLVKATSYFSLKKYWDIPEEAALIASFLDPQIKNQKFIDNKTWYKDFNEEEHHQPLAKNITKNYESFNMPTYNSTIANDLVSDLYSIEELDKIDKETKVNCYPCEPTQKRQCDPFV
ncbi:38165_t:CDS:2 [Gigaspora margarita]|uniref:38165_t:CDS:1 n=1 Tax=Gigaspora margarita TaxID=4874 RepID=A0ABN7US02_GIGMA|nr:38165_t:CDS:2 [Gigaspora margarita]